ncbi:glycosyl hydrolase family 28-related protein [Caballeronia sp. AZ7_KS35]|uniref:glycosyl hydrolase family 28-related protein n=1 Tax=Caballeronia sp. AZ7_KS35 TaxID=2921762 RepID=UPI002027A0AB|nr:glycosyl hydrolase family 28-related protein [Caballeronia sp. AZ7_KS35]
MSQVTFPLTGNSYSDDGSTGRDMLNGGHTEFLLPMLQETVATVQIAIENAGGSSGSSDAAAASAAAAAASAAQAASDRASAAASAAAAHADAATVHIPLLASNARKVLQVGTDESAMVWDHIGSSALPDGSIFGDLIKAGLSRVVDSIATLRALNHTYYQRAFVTGYYGAGDGGGGAYRYDASDTTSADNGGSIIVATDGGRWKLVFNGSLDVRQFGAKGDSSTDDTAAVNKATAALAAAGGGTLYFSAAPAGVAGGRFVLNGVVVNTPNVTWQGTRSPNGGLLVQQVTLIKQSGFTARHLDCQFSGSLNGSSTACFIVYSTTLTLRDFLFEYCTFNGFFYSVDFLGILDPVPNADAQHLQNPIYNTKILFCKSTAPVGQNSGHFQHQSVYGCLVMGCETYNGQNCSSYNFTRDCRDIRVIGNYDESSAWGAVEIENCPLANATVSGNTFESTVEIYASIWVDDSASVTVYGNSVRGILKASSENAAPAMGAQYATEVCPVTTAYFQNNTARSAQVMTFGPTYVSGSMNVDFKDNTFTTSGTQAIQTDQYFTKGTISGNRLSGAPSFFCNFSQLQASSSVKLHDNVTGGIPCSLSGSSAGVNAYNNDFIWTGVQTETNLPGMNIAQGVIKLPSVTQTNIAAGASANFAFTTYQALTQFAMTAFAFRCLCRSGDTPANDYVKFDVFISDESGTPVCTVSPLSKLATNNASNFSVAASISGAVLTVTVTNSNASKLLSVTMFCENLMRI